MDRKPQYIYECNCRKIIEAKNCRKNKILKTTKSTQEIRGVSMWPIRVAHNKQIYKHRYGCKVYWRIPMFYLELFIVQLFQHQNKLMVLVMLLKKGIPCFFRSSNIKKKHKWSLFRMPLCRSIIFVLHNILFSLLIETKRHIDSF